MDMIEREFSLSDDICYLNHAAVSPWPKRTVDAVRCFAEENGSNGSRYYDRWLKTEQLLRQQLQRLDVHVVEGVLLQVGSVEHLALEIND